MLRALAHRVKELRANDLGVAAVETALIAPVALILMSVGFAGGQALEIYHKTVVTAHTVTDLVSRTAYAPDPNTESGGADPAEHARHRSRDVADDHVSL